VHWRGWGSRQPRARVVVAHRLDGGG
jgi:hypothetical protein